MDLKAKSRLGALRRNELYGNPGTPEGRSKGGKKTAERLRANPELCNGFAVRKTILRPDRCEELAELIGILLGDGGINSKHQFFVTFNYQTDLRHAEHTQHLVKKLFGVSSNIYRRKRNNGADVVVNSSNAIDFLLEQGMMKGSKVKQQVGVPAWIEDNSTYRFACLRGLMDTDGGVYFHDYRVNGKDYRYLKLCFTNCSKPLLNFVFRVLNELNIKSVLTPKRVFVFSTAGVKKYFKEIGSSNPKHIARYETHFGEVLEWLNRVAC